MSTAALVDPLEGQFETIRDLLYAAAGISLTDAKRQLVQARVARRLRQVGATSVSDYVAFVQSPAGRDELTKMVDVLTTNKTSFFRESAHFDFLADCLETRPRSAPPVTLWSAGCSSGEEPYTIAIVLAEHARMHRVRPGRILATDISDRVLRKAQAAEYAALSLEPVPSRLAGRYLVSSGGDKARVVDEIRATVRFARLNLMGPWPMTGPFDAIFCRNVMIYFDGPTRAVLVNRFAALLAPGGLLFVGHAESLSSTSMKHGLSYVRPAVYRR